MIKLQSSGAGAVALGLMVAAGGVSAAPAAESAGYGTPARLISGVYTPADRPMLDKAQYVWGGRSYCWYDDGWQGPGYYWCGYAWRRGWGWGGPLGWHGWGRGWGYRGYYNHGGYYGRGGHYGHGGYYGHDGYYHRGWDHGDGRWGHDR